MRDDLFGSIEPQDLRGLRIIGFAFVSGVFLFATIATALPFLGSGPSPFELATEARPLDIPVEEPDLGLVQILSMVHAFLFVIVFAMASVVPSMLAGRTPDKQKVGLFILRWAMLEGAALFGTVVVLLAGMDGVVPDQPIYYANLSSALVLLVFVVMDTWRLGDAVEVR